MRNTPLFLAVDTSHRHVIKLLLEHAVAMHGLSKGITDSLLLEVNKKEITAMIKQVEDDNMDRVFAKTVKLLKKEADIRGRVRRLGRYGFN